MLPTLRTTTAALAATVLAGLCLAAPAPAEADPVPTRTGPTATKGALDRAELPDARRAATTPGSLTGYVFDTCTAPAQEVMDAWWLESPYAGVGVYVGGSNRLCQDQPNLTADWVRTQQKRGWHVFSIWVGPQAACSGYPSVMAADRPTAFAQGRAEAATAVTVARSLGIRSGATLYYDLEDYDIGSTECRQAALSFLSGWTEGLHAENYDSGVYSNIAAAITSLDYADRVAPGEYTMPDDIWFAWDNGRADTATDSRVQGPRWDDHARVHQYALDVTEGYGGWTLAIDRNWADVGRGSVARAGKALCKGVDVDLRRYPVLQAGARGPAVEAAQCLLRRAKVSKAPITGRYDARTAAAVRKAQAKLDLKATGKLTRPTWAALLARGSQPVLKVGSAGEDVRRLQRALTAGGKRTTVDGVYSQRTEKAVSRYQRKAGLPRSGVVTPAVWDALLGR